jgi:hypothetical protein
VLVIALVTVAVDATTQKVLLVVAAVLVGSSVGLVGALIFGLLAGGRRRPRRAPVVRMPGPAAMHIPPAQPLVEAPPAPGPYAAPAIGSVPTLFAVDADVARDRHRELYDAEYAKQLRHVDTLRRTIGTRLAVAGGPHEPSEEPDA